MATSGSHTDNSLARGDLECHTVQMPQENPNDGHDGKERLSPVNFIFLACAVLGVVIAILVAVLTKVSIWTIAPISAAILLALAMIFTGITKTKWFHLAASWTLSAALLASGIYVAAKSKQAGTHQHPASGARVQTPPTLDFVLTSPATVPWCDYFKLTTTGTVPDGYKILVFDASTDVNYNVTSPYSYDAVAQPVPRVPDEWEAGPVYVSSQYVHNGQGQNVIRNGRPVSNSGYTVAIFALLVPASDMQLLDNVTAEAWGLKSLPPNRLVTAKLNVIRNGDVKACARPND
jgi:hypothetical protein